MCTLASNVNAEEEVHYIINEDFSEGFDKIQSNAYLNKDINGWEIYGCALQKNLIIDNALWLSYTSLDKAYATTPEFNAAEGSNAILTFKAANSAEKKYATVNISITNGYFDGHKTTFITTINKDAAANFVTINTKLYSIGKNTRLKFSLTNDNKYYIDDVQVIAAENLTLSETAKDISLSEKTADVTLGRTLQGGIWNTLCLPFDVDKAFTLPKALGEYQNIQLRTFSSYTGGTINFEDKESVEAGTPFLIKINKTVTNPTFPLVDVKTTSPQAVEHGGVSMVGTYGQTSISKDAIFLTSSGELMKPSGSTTLNGLRAYFTTKDGSRLTINFGDATAVKNVQAPAATTGDWFTLDGRRLASQPTKKGLYIRNGKKIIIK